MRHYDVICCLFDGISGWISEGYVTSRGACAHCRSVNAVRIHHRDLSICMRIRPRQLPRVPALLALIAAQLVLLVSAIYLTPAPRIDTTFGGASVEIAADRSWTILPGQCANITWDLEGIQSLYINAEGKIAHDQMAFCPTPRATSLNFNITTASGESRTFAFMIQFMPAAIVAWLTFLVFLLPLLIAVYYLATMRLTERSVVDLSPLLMLPALLSLRSAHTNCATHCHCERSGYPWRRLHQCILARARICVSGSDIRPASHTSSSSRQAARHAGGSRSNRRHLRHCCVDVFARWIRKHRSMGSPGQCRLILKDDHQD